MTPTGNIGEGEDRLWRFLSCYMYDGKAAHCASIGWGDLPGGECTYIAFTGEAGRETEENREVTNT